MSASVLLIQVQLVSRVETSPSTFTSQTLKLPVYYSIFHFPATAHAPPAADRGVTRVNYSIFRFLLLSCLEKLWNVCSVWPMKSVTIHNVARDHILLLLFTNTLQE